MTSFITSAILSIVNGALTVSRTLLSFGYSARDRVVNATLDALERLGFRAPRTQKEKIRELKKVQAVIEDEIEDLQEQERENVPEGQPNAILLREQNGAKDYRIENTHIKNIPALKEYIMPLVREKVVENIPTKLNLVVKITLIHLSKTDDAGNPLKKPHHLEHKAKMIPQENLFEPQYDDLWETLFSKFYRITTVESGWRLFSIDYSDIILSNYEQRGGQGFQPLPS